jgi:hypothetical protein
MRLAPRVPATAAAALLALTLVAGCGGDTTGTAEDGASSASPSESGQPSESPASEGSAASSDPEDSDDSGGSGESDDDEAAGTVVEVEVEGDSITPNGARVEAEVGEPITLEITSDRPGELHVHGTPEQYVEFGSGTVTRELTLDQPGIVEVEEHDTGFVVMQLQVG